MLGICTLFPLGTDAFRHVTDKTQTKTKDFSMWSSCLVQQCNKTKLGFASHTQVCLFTCPFGKRIRRKKKNKRNRTYRMLRHILYLFSCTFYRNDRPLRPPKVPVVRPAECLLVTCFRKPGRDLLQTLIGIQKHCAFLKRPMYVGRRAVLLADSFWTESSQ